MGNSIAKHTAEPWTVDRSQCGELEPFDSADRHLLNGNSDIPLEERETNGRVIESAPVMLRVLRAYLEVIEGISPCNKTSHYDPSKCLLCTGKRIIKHIDEVPE